MGKSLTDTAKAILMKEANYPEIKSDPARGLKGEDPKTANAKTLAPGSKSKEEMHKLDTNYGIEDKGAPVVKPTDKNGIFDSGTGKMPKRPADKDGGEKTPVSTSPSSVKEEVDGVINQMIEDGLSEEEILSALSEMYDDEVLALVLDEEQEEEVEEDQEMVAEEEAVEEEEEVVAEEQEEVEPVQQLDINLDEHIEALFAGEELSEDFKAKAKTIFEAALNEKIKAEVAILEQAYAEQLEEELETVKTELAESTDKYLSYVVEQWASENEVAIESNLKTELVEDFIVGLKGLFQEHHFEMPDEAIPVVETMAEKIEELEARLNEEIEKNVELVDQLNESKSFEILVDVCADLTDTQAERLKSLAEGIRFTDPEEYEAKLLTLKETYFSRKVNTENVVEDTAPVSDGQTLTENLSGPMAAYVKGLGKIKK